jgi:hypothetical protein
MKHRVTTENYEDLASHGGPEVRLPLIPLVAGRGIGFVAVFQIINWGFW